ncbi:RDD family protein [Sediminibacterium goheungense]|uniref:RDD family protein n=1 Tax=Sediminibacterium goheungense TaxID=1086393 RepID=A0A4R6ITV1_9BACT|nr:RDD family protein [Sediminibacterium goheungense]TDO25325.1 RDD family protein [Sediminibacterium goheungense]
MRKVGEGTRILNFLIDTLIVFLLAFAFNKFWMFQVKYWGYPYFNFGWIFFGMMFVYYSFFEIVFQRSPAKWFSYTKVVNKQGGRAAFWRILLRSLARVTIIDLFFIPFLGKPLHDWVSGTEVIEK